MRIISGKLGGRQIEAPSGHRTHPMSEKVRGGLFNALGDLTDLTVLDAFAGSGAVGLESVSRGASSVILIERDRTAQDTIERNIATLDVSRRSTLIRANAATWSDNNKDKAFDIVILDPPYDAINMTTVNKLLRQVRPAGLCVLSWPGNEEPPVLVEFDCIKTAHYGDALLAFYRKIS